MITRSPIRTRSHSEPRENTPNTTQQMNPELQTINERRTENSTIPMNPQLQPTNINMLPDRIKPQATSLSITNEEDLLNLNQSVSTSNNSTNMNQTQSFIDVSNSSGLSNIPPIFNTTSTSHSTSTLPISSSINENTSLTQIPQMIFSNGHTSLPTQSSIFESYHYPAFSRMPINTCPQNSTNCFQPPTNDLMLNTTMNYQPLSANNIISPLQTYYSQLSQIPQNIPMNNNQVQINQNHINQCLMNQLSTIQEQLNQINRQLSNTSTSNINRSNNRNVPSTSRNPIPTTSSSTTRNNQPPQMPQTNETHQNNSTQFIPFIQQPLTNSNVSTTSLNALRQWSQSFSNLNLGNNLTTSFNPNVILHDLPEFEGKPKDWLIFISQFIQSTNQYGYNNFQNVTRLNKSLKGKARKSVSTLLINANNLYTILHQLEFLFGRPELLLEDYMTDIHQIEPIQDNKPEMLIHLSLELQNFTCYLESLPNAIIYLCNPTLISEIVQKLPVLKREQWIRFALNIQPFYTLKDLSNWLIQETQYLSLVLSKEEFNSNYDTAMTYNIKTNQNSNMCKCCNKEKHPLTKCPEFKKLTIIQRWEFVKKMGIFYCCLRTGHRTIDCKFKEPCNIEGCEKLHNKFLHKRPAPSLPTCNNIEIADGNLDPIDDYELEENHINAEDYDGNYVMNCQDFNEKIWFKIIPIKLHGPKEIIDTFALIDEGSSISLIDYNLYQQLGYNKRTVNQTNLTIKWFGNTTSTECSDIVNIDISGFSQDTKIFTMNDVRTSRKLNLPQQSVNFSNISKRFKIHPEIKYNNAKPLLLIGLDNSNLIYSKESHENNGLVISKTPIGWTIFGKMKSSSENRCQIAEILDESEEQTIKKLMEDYFELDNLGLNGNEISPPETRIRNILQTTTKKIIDDDRYETGLLWNSEEIDLPDNFSNAFKRLLHIEKRMKNDPVFKQRYEDGIMKYVEKQYARKLSDTEINMYPQRRWYLPHFVALNPNKPSKFRIVFDAAAKFKNVSLNSNLDKGPDLNTPLLKVLLNFRIGNFAICGDIKEMFSQIKIIEADQHSQRFLWRHGDPKKPMETYIFTSMTFGATCSPCSAQYVKNINAEKYSYINPKAADAIINSHYVDDYVISFENKKEAIDITNAVKKIHSKAGFHLRNFVTNCEEITSAISDPEDRNELIQPTINKSSIEKILGLYWNHINDTYTFLTKFNKIPVDVLSNIRRPTKRELLRLTMSIFDPFGFLNHFTIQAKLILRMSWMQQCKWDDEIPVNTTTFWNNWLKNLQKLPDIQIPRKFFLMSSQATELHIFVDASDSAFSAVAYLRRTSNENIEVAFVISKTRLAPLKSKLSIPRLELQAALLGAKLKEVVITNITLKIDRTCFWTDSKVVLFWINSNYNKYKPYVSHRIAKIQNLSNPSEWNWINTNLNVADEATKLNKKFILDNGNNWFRGSKKLYDNVEINPLQSPIYQLESTLDLEERQSHGIINHISSEDFLNISKFSSYWTLIRVVGWILKAKNILKKESPEICPTLPLNILYKAKLFIIKLVQEEVFTEEINCIKLNKILPKTSSIRQMSPSLDNNGIMRVDGRLKFSSIISYGRKHPIIIPKNHYLSKLIISDYHNSCHHQFTNTVINNICMKFYIPKIKQQVRKLETNCNQCKMLRAKCINAQMGPIPEERLGAYIRPFTFSGIDFCGPFEIKMKGKIADCWILVITCLTTRAVHLEVVEKLNTEYTLLRLNDFMNRRGIPRRIRSDCASYFVCARKTMHQILNSSVIYDSLSKRNIEWVHNCPGTPHTGGIWEVIVRLVKNTLQVSLMKSKVPYEAFRSFVIDAENLINNRPLTDVPFNINDEEPLTPNHFLIGHTNLLPAPDVGENINVKKQINILNNLKRALWKKWLLEYLPLLNKRSKWYSSPNSNINVNDIVLILHNNKWVKGLVVNIHGARDQKQRFIDVRTSNGISKHHVSRVLFPNIERRGD